MKPVYLAAKDPEDVDVVTFDFATQLAGETINGAAVVTITAYSGVDGAPANVLNGAAAVDGTAKKITQGVKAGIANVDYRIKCKVPTTGGRTLAQARILPVRNA